MSVLRLYHMFIYRRMIFLPPVWIWNILGLWFQCVTSVLLQSSQTSHFPLSNPHPSLRKDTWWQCCHQTGSANETGSADTGCHHLISRLTNTHTFHRSVCVVLLGVKVAAAHLVQSCCRQSWWWWKGHFQVVSNLAEAPLAGAESAHHSPASLHEAHVNTALRRCYSCLKRDCSFWTVITHPNSAWITE